METRVDHSTSNGRPELWGSAGLERLEQRALLAGDPFPLLTDLTAANDTVLRIDTTLGDIDIELFDTGANPAPLTAANFLGYVRRGDYDESFFHRAAFLGTPTPDPNQPFVLQGGGFRFIDGTGLSTIPAQPAVQNEFSAQRSNLIRTLAMAKLGNNPNSATDQFFFNMRDNGGSPAFLDSQNGGFTVFARVVNDRSWGVVQAIMSLTTRNLNSQLNNNGAFDTVPVAAGTPANPTVSESILIAIKDIEVIKEKNVQEFYTDVTYYPEGFAGSTINEFLPIENAGDHTVFYQVIARAETPQGTAANGFTWFRDKVISTGSIGPTSRGGITVSHFGTGGAPSADDLVAQGVPYSLEVRATDTLFANMSHYDFGTSTGEAFTRTTSTTWGFSDLFKQTGTGGVSDFLVWENPNNEDASVSINFYFQNQAPFTAVVNTGMFRRGGVNLNLVASIPDNTAFSVQISSTQPLIGALTHFDSRTAGDPLGSAELGVSGSGSRFGAIPFGNVGPGALGISNQESISVLNTNTSQSVVVNLTLSYLFNGQTQTQQIPAALIVAPQRRGTFDFTTVAQLADGRRYSVRYDVLPGSAQVYAGWVHKQSFPGIANADDIANPVGVVAATTWEFAEGFMDPARAGHDVFETVSVYNPHILAFGATPTPANVTIRLLYGDSFVLSLPSVQVASGDRIDFDLHTIQAVLDQGTLHQRFFYSIEVVADVVVVAQMRHFDLTLGGASPSGGFATLGAPSGTVTRLDSLT